MVPKKYKAELAGGQSRWTERASKEGGSPDRGVERSAVSRRTDRDWRLDTGVKEGKDSTPVRRSGSWAEGEKYSRKDGLGKQWERFTSGCFEVGCLDVESNG